MSCEVHEVGYRVQLHMVPPRVVLRLHVVVYAVLVFGGLDVVCCSCLYTWMLVWVRLVDLLFSQNAKNCSSGHCVMLPDGVGKTLPCTGCYLGWSALVHARISKFSVQLSTCAAGARSESSVRGICENLHTKHLGSPGFWQRTGTSAACGYFWGVSQPSRLCNTTWRFELMGSVLSGFDRT